jgi:hypothetical protein
MASPHITIAIFFMVLLPSSSWLSQARMMPSGHAQEHGGKSSFLARTTTTTTGGGGASPQDFRQSIEAPPPPASKTATKIVKRSWTAGWSTTQGSVPSPGIGHHA